jgi:Flp pilus assembly protein TadG
MIPHVLPIRRSRAGQSMVEFSLVCFMLGIVMLSVIEIGRMMLVYTAVANAARAGARYAIVHGSTRTTGAAMSNASGPGNNPAQVVSVVTDFAAAGAVNTARLVITVTYPGGSNAPGQLISVTAKYPYDPLTRWLSMTMTLGSTTEGVIVF